jgi:hypothetical protein
LKQGTFKFNIVAQFRVFFAHGFDLKMEVKLCYNSRGKVLMNLIGQSLPKKNRETMVAAPA